MKYIVIVFIVLFALSSLYAQAPDTAWTRYYGTDDGDIGNFVTQTSDGGYAVLGYSQFASNEGFTLYKTNSFGYETWSRNYGTGIGYCVRETMDNGLIMTGSASWFSNCSLYVVRTNNQGDTAWTTKFHGIESACGYDIQQTSDGGYIVVGTTWSVHVCEDFYIVKLDSMGNPQWIKTYGAHYSDVLTSVAQTSDGGFIIAGHTNSFGWNAPTAKNVYLLRLDSIGDSLWGRSYGGMKSDKAYSLQITHDGGFIMAGETESFGAAGEDGLIIRTNEYGDTLWTRQIRGDNRDRIYSILQTADGKFTCGGYTKSFGLTSQDFLLVKLDSNGDVLWKGFYGTPANEEGGYCQITTDGGYVIVGSTQNFDPDWDFYLIKTEPDAGISEEAPKAEGFGKIRFYPNPFLNCLFVDGCEEATIYNSSGRLVANIKDKWNGKDTHGHTVPPGIYFLKADGKYVAKMVKVR